MNWFEIMGPKAVETLETYRKAFAVAASTWAGRPTLGDVTRVEEGIAAGLHAVSVFDPNADPQHFELEELVRCFVSDLARGDVLAVTTMVELISDAYRADNVTLSRGLGEALREINGARKELDAVREERDQQRRVSASLSKRCSAVEARARNAEERAKVAEADLAAARAHLGHSRGYAKSLEARLAAARAVESDAAKSVGVDPAKVVYAGADVVRIVEELARRVVALEAREA